MPKKKKSKSSGTIQNRRVRHDYAAQDSFLVGMVLEGWEVKSLRMGHGQLRGAYVNLNSSGSALQLINSAIMPPKGVGQNVPAERYTRTRLLLAKKREIEHMQTAKQQGLSIVPLEILTKTRYIKLRIATAKSKKEYDKRDSIKKRDVERDAMRKFSS